MVLHYYSAHSPKILMFQGVMCRSLEGHAHWVNSIALNTDYVIRTGAVDPTAVHRGKGQKVNGEDFTCNFFASFIRNIFQRAMPKSWL